MSNDSRESSRAAILPLIIITFVLFGSSAEARTQSLCVNPGGTIGCAATISDAVAMITAHYVDELQFHRRLDWLYADRQDHE
jgi:hypothetical protein